MSKNLTPIIGEIIMHKETGRLYKIEKLYAENGWGIMRLHDGSEWAEPSWSQFNYAHYGDDFYNG